MFEKECPAFLGRLSKRSLFLDGSGERFYIVRHDVGNIGERSWGAGPQDKRSWGRRQYARPAWLWYDREMGALPGRKTVAPFPSEGEESALVVSAPGREGRDLLFLALFLEGETFALSLLLASGSERSDLLFA